MLLRLSSLLALFFPVLLACQNLVAEVDPAKLPGMDPKLVVNSYLSPQDTVLAVSVSRSQTVLGEVVTDSVNTVSDATVRMTSEGKTVTLPYDPELRVYALAARQLPVLVGKTYQLEVRVPGFETVTSSCTVPKAIPISELKLDSVRRSEVGVELRWEYTVRAVWADPTGEVNYYRVAGYGECVGRIPRIPGTAHIDSTSPNVLLRGTLDFGWQDQLIADQNQDGQVLVSGRGEVPQFFDYSFYDDSTRQTYTGSYPFGKPLTLRVSVLHTDEAYYRYHRARQQQRRSQNNPFAEPVLMPSNIEGGLGCFSAYNRATAVVVVR